MKPWRPGDFEHSQPPERIWNPLDPGTWYEVQGRGALEGVRMDCMGACVLAGESQERREHRCRYIHWWLLKYAAMRRAAGYTVPLYEHLDTPAAWAQYLPTIDATEVARSIMADGCFSGYVNDSSDQSASA